MKTILSTIALCCCLYLQAGQVKITGKTAKFGVIGKSKVTISAVINGKNYKVCKNKRFKRDKSYTLKCNAPQQVDYITVAAIGKDIGESFWSVEYFVIEFPNGDKWRFPEQVDTTPTYLSSKGLTFYFTGPNAGELRLGKHGGKTKFWCKGKKLNATPEPAKVASTTK